MNGLSCYFLISSILRKPKDMNDNIWMVAASFIGCNLTLTAGHFIELRSSNLNMFAASVGMLLSIAIIPFYIAAIISLGRNLTVLPEANELKTGGIYSISRHPLYSCNIYWFFTSILIYQSKVIIFTSIVQAIFQIIRAKNEEKILEKNFPEYDDYRKKVWWIGRIKEKQLKAGTGIN
jgi:Putative protein-S-isoprenylcysteine methyltransferase